MQNSGLGNCVNALASLNTATRIPMVLVMSQRGDIGEFNPAQVPMGQFIEPLLGVLGFRYIRPRTIGELEAHADGLISLAHVSAMPVGILLPSVLTGGKPA